MAKFSTKPYLLKARTNKEGLAPLNIRYNYDGKTNGFSTGLKIRPSDFDDKKGMVKNSVKNAAETNNILRSYQTVIEDLAEKHNDPTYQNIKELVAERFIEVKVESQYHTEGWKKQKAEIKEMVTEDVTKVMLYKVRNLDKEIEEVQQRLNELLAQREKFAKSGFYATNAEKTQYLDLLNKFPSKFIHSKKRGVQNIQSWVNNLIGFHEKTNTPYSFKIFDTDFYQKYAKYLMYNSEHDYYNNTFGTAIKRLQNFLNWVQDVHGVEVTKHYKKYKVTKEEKEIVYLDEKELNLLWAYRDKVKPHEVKFIDLCVFQNLTGLRYSDVNASNWKIENGIMTGKTIKTKGNYLVPLELDSRITEILEKYNYNLGIAAEQKYNENIKLILEALYVKNDIHQKPIKIVRYKLAEEFVEHHMKHKLMTSHSNRRGFCTRMWQAGYSERDILQMLGSKTNTELRKYVANTQEDILRKVREKQAATV
ncbi:tyrosine-type recombinase/integrase [Nafulsella turpanensis]|uniref:tyrosine-type recombinase/integrase n=1 Tax=Nafulsella turpanensis TaxID=1265690 RepID=UPI00034A3F9E|nr:tyrosine-type recombinase/integrase [Nafulsella turpanensis]